VNHLIIAAVAKALKQFPEVNSRLEEDKVNYLPDVNIGIATALEGGLVVPVLMKADELSWDELVVQSKRIVQQAREGKIIGMGRGTFTITNLGMFGVDCFTAIINPPESAILAVGTVKNEVVDIGGGIGIRPITKLTLCSDHRVVDGVVAAKFLQAIKVYLEEQVVCE
jgi:pyruvate dehydrogenase E2 component (dihydrolipoamide acetyltransferase)